MQLHIPTVFVAIIVASLILATSIGSITRRDDEDGLIPIIAALGLVALAFLLFPLRGVLPDRWSLWVANVAVSSAYALMLVAVAKFQKRRLPAWMVFGPTGLIAVAVWIAHAWLSVGLFDRVILTNTIFLFQDALLLCLLITGVRKTVGRGQFLVIAGVALNMAALVARVVILYTAELESVTFIADGGVSQSIIFLSSFAFLILLTIGFVLMVKERADDRNRRMALTDPLTGCWNRLRIEECAKLEMAQRQRYGVPVSILMIDIDFFKAVNDHHGHVMGDRLLKEFSLMVRGCLRSADQFGRWGGEEFVVLLPSSDADAAAVIAERIRRVIASTTFADGLQITASFGFAEYSPDEPLMHWLGRADAALYLAKNAGRNCVEPRQGIDAPMDARVMLDLVRLVWKPEYETGDERIDAQHKEFFSQGNGSLDAILCCESKADVRKRIERFLAFVEVHFQEEEAWLVAKNWPGATEHARRHQSLGARAADLLAKHDNAQLDATEFLNFFVNELILQHLLIEDREFGVDLKGKSA